MHTCMQAHIHCKHTYIPCIQAVVDGDSKLAEEQAALSTLRTFVGGALKTLASGKIPTPNPTLTPHPSPWPWP